METPTINQESIVPQRPPEIVKIEQERSEALMITFAKIEMMQKELGGNLTTLIAYGREYPIREGSVADILVAKAQSLHGVATKVLDEVKGVDYRLEEASTKIETFLAAYEELMIQYAGILENNPKAAEMVARMVPGMEALTQAGAREAADGSHNKGAHNLDAKYAAA